MANPTFAAPPAPAERNSLPWYRQLNGYHWLVLTVATAAWAFDCLSQQIFNLTRKPAMDELAITQEKADFFAPLSTTALLVGWATGGIIFGVLGDRIGRAKTLTIMIVCYSLSTGLCGLSGLWGPSWGPWQYVLFCFITGVGAGGIFPIACTLVAESLPDRTRPQALGMVQTFSALGNVGAGAISLGMVALLSHGVITSHWRWMFSVGIVPSLLAVIVARRLREPEPWVRSVAEGRASKRKAGIGELFSDPRWRRNAIVGMLLAASGVVGLWGIGVFSNDLTQTILKKEGKTPHEILQWAAWTLIVFNVGAFFGMYAFARVTQKIGRRPTFAIFFTIALVATAMAFLCVKQMPRDLWMVALMGGAQLSVFGGYAIYLPELFPTRLRSTGTSFCYNVGRYVAALGPFTLTWLRPYLTRVLGDPVLAFRYAGVAMCSCFLVGLVALLFAPETKGQPLPE